MADELKNYIGGTESDPCPTGLTTFKIFGSLYCNTRDYDSWRLAARDMYTRGILPTWEQYVQIMAAAAASADTTWVPGDHPLYARVEQYRAEYEKLPDSVAWKGGSGNWVQQVISLMQMGEVALAELREAVSEAGQEPVTLPAGPQGNVPADPAVRPWIWWLLGGIVVVGGGAAIAYGVSQKGSR